MFIRKAERKQARIKLAIQGPAGSGKTYSSLMLSLGLTQDLGKVCIIDTENGSADLYANLGGYSVILLQSPFTPEKYISSLELAYKSGFQCVILDSISHSWEYLLDYHANLAGNSFTNWSKVTPRHNALIQAILNTPVHVIATIRTKQDYVLNQKGDGKFVPEKVGLKGIQRDGTDYEFTTVFDLDIKHNATCTKDRTGLFMDHPPFKMTAETGEKIRDWCSEGVSLDSIIQRIGEAQSLRELTALYQQYTPYYPLLEAKFKSRKQELTGSLAHTENQGNGTISHSH